MLLLSLSALAVTVLLMCYAYRTLMVIAIAVRCIRSHHSISTEWNQLTVRAHVHRPCRVLRSTPHKNLMSSLLWLWARFDQRNKCPTTFSGIRLSNLKCEAALLRAQRYCEIHSVVEQYKLMLCCVYADVMCVRHNYIASNQAIKSTMPFGHPMHTRTRTHSPRHCQPQIDL